MAYGKLVNGVFRYAYENTITYEGGCIIKPSVEQLNAHGIYEVDTIQEDGTDEIVGGRIKHYVGAPYQPTEEEQKAQQIEALKSELATYDYIGVKIAMGVATRDEYAEQIAYTETLRQQINELQEG